MASARNLAVIAIAVAALVAVVPTTVDAHAGHFHLCPDTPSGRNYIRYEVGNCTTFVSSSPNVTVTGKVTAWVYAYKNCSDEISSALELNTIFTLNGQPAAVNTTGYAYTGTCANRGSIYLNNVTAGNNGDNMIFWKPTLAAANGSLCGNAANSFVMRSVAPNGSPEANPLSSVVISADGLGEVACCDLNLFPKPQLATIISQTAPCDVFPPPPVQSPTPAPTPVPSPGGGAAGAARTSVLALLGAALLSALLLLS